MADRPVEILALPAKLHELFDGLLPQKTDGDAEQNERDFLSRALAAYTLHKRGGATLQVAADGVVDGGGDCGIDGIYFSPITNILWLVQSKYVHSGINEPDLGDVTKFKTGVEYMLDGNFDAFAENAKITDMRAQIEAALANAATQVRALLCYSGLSLISDDRKQLFDALRVKVSKDQEDGYFRFASVNLTTLNDWVTGADDGIGIESLELKIFFPGLVTQPYETIYGLIPLERLKALHQEHGPKLIRANIRGFKGRTEVNDDIEKTLAGEAGLFHYLNNGLTAYCDRLELNNLDRTKTESKRVTARGFAIINGAQTLGTIGKAIAAPAEGAPPTGYAFIKIISLEKCEDDAAFAERISRAANFQNHVGLKDFAAAYPLHEQMSLTLRPHNVGYHYRIDEDTPDSDAQNFTIEEALTACACVNNARDCDLLYRVAANRDSLRSLEMVFPATEAVRTRHERVFPADLSARTTWRAVQAQRIVLRVMSDNARASAGVLKSFYTNARWVVLAAIFNRLKPEQGEALAMTADEQAAVSAAAVNYAEKLLAQAVAKGFAGYQTIGGTQTLTAARDFQSIFKTQTDCQLLFAALKAEIWRADNAAGAAPADGDA